MYFKLYVIWSVDLLWFIDSPPYTIKRNTYQYIVYIWSSINNYRPNPPLSFEFHLFGKYSSHFKFCLKRCTNIKLHLRPTKIHLKSKISQSKLTKTRILTVKCQLKYRFYTEWLWLPTNYEYFVITKIFLIIQGTY